MSAEVKDLPFNNSNCNSKNFNFFAFLVFSNFKFSLWRITTALLTASLYILWKLHCSSKNCYNELNRSLEFNIFDTETLMPYLNAENVGGTQRVGLLWTITDKWHSWNSSVMKMITSSSSNHDVITLSYFFLQLFL